LDVKIVVGGGHAGCEATQQQPTMGSTHPLLITMNTGTNCFKCSLQSKQLGGVAKRGQIVREI